MEASNAAGAIHAEVIIMATKRKTVRRRAAKPATGRHEPKESAARRGRERGTRPARQSGQAKTKRQACLDTPQRASLEELQSVTGWQPHSVRGFLAGTVKKKLGLKLTSEKTGDGSRRYRVDHVRA
jgi:hypothetical protein